VIPYFNRVTQKIENEQVYGSAWLEWAYRNRFGHFLTDAVFSRRFVSQLFGMFEDSPLSRSKILTFVRQYGIQMEDFESRDYRNFNEFFIRKFKPGVRPFANTPGVFCAGAEARYLVFEDLKPRQKFKVKGIEIDLVELLGDSSLAPEFEGGSLILARLCPVDYHRFHFPFTGRLLRHQQVKGRYHSVNPVAFSMEPRVFLENERQVAILENSHFGNVAMIEVGALGVGKIVQSAWSDDTPLPFEFEKGQEKGYFLFGGSTVIWLVQKQKIRLSDDLLKNSRIGLETWIPLGQPLGERIE
jgi:phosphatidylserine decarboxylase